MGARSADPAGLGGVWRSRVASDRATSVAVGGVVTPGSIAIPVGGVRASGELRSFMIISGVYRIFVPPGVVPHMLPPGVTVMFSKAGGRPVGGAGRRGISLGADMMFGRAAGKTQKSKT